MVKIEIKIETKRNRDLVLLLKVCREHAKVKSRMMLGRHLVCISKPAEGLSWLRARRCIVVFCVLSTVAEKLT